MIRNRENLIFFIALGLITCVSVGACFAVSMLAGWFSVGGFSLICAAIYIYNRRRYKEIARLSDYIRKMSDGDVVFDIRDNAEGELSILKNDIYKLTLRLAEQASLLRGEKLVLKEMLFDISHQLKTPITSLTVMADLLETDSLPEDKRLEFTLNLQTGLSRMDWLVKSLLKLARLDAETDLLKKEPVLIKDLISQAINQIKTIAKIKGQVIKNEFDAGITVTCDRNWTVEALVNILKNASEHTPENGYINISASENPICVWICITDSGVGIDSSDLPHLFKRFYKGKHSSKDSIGIGLAMSLSVMQKQNGDIEVTSTPNAGSAFTLKFFK